MTRSRSLPPRLPAAAVVTDQQVAPAELVERVAWAALCPATAVQVASAAPAALVARAGKAALAPPV